MKRLKVLLVENFNEFFIMWLENDMFSVKDLRLKVIIFLVLILMLRFLDIVLNNIFFDDILGYIFK